MILFRLGRRWLLLPIVLAMTLFLVNGFANAANIDDRKFSVSVKRGFITLSANGAPLKLVVIELGKQLGISVKASISDQEKVTANFTNLPIREAIKRLTANYALLDGKDGKITKIILFPRADNNVSSPSFSSEQEPDYGTDEVPLEESDPTQEQIETDTEADQQAADEAQEESQAEEAAQAEEQSSDETPQSDPFNFEFDPNSQDQIE